MKKYLLFIFLSAMGFISPIRADTSEQINFLALELPQDTTQDIINTCQPKIRELIKKKASDYADKILYHTPENIHISLIRFNEIKPKSLLDKYIRLFKKDEKYIPTKNIADKVREAKLNVTHSGFIVYEFQEPVSLTEFVNALIRDLNLNYS